jgi:ribA/ribD-fused uncharacterized protein
MESNLTDKMNKTEKKVINFYSHHDEETGYLSNFYESDIEMDGKIYKTSEHYFQSAKFFITDTDYAEQIRLIDTPGKSAKMGRDRKKPLRSDWESVKYGIMKEVLIQKFKQNEELLKRLLDTGEAELVEHTKNDNIWGDGGDGSGKNLLGKCLVEVRAILQELNK